MPLADDVVQADARVHAPQVRHRSGERGRRAGGLQRRQQRLQVWDQGANERAGRDDQRKAQGRLVEGQAVTNWKQALAQLAAAYPDRINPYL